MSKTLLFEFMGTMGSVIVCISTLPQIIKTYRTKRADDFSILYLFSLMTGMVIMDYSVYVYDPVFIIGNGLSLFSTGLLIVLWFRYRR
jgi:MtN3 and saliva related transmembrane protein